MIPTPAHCPRLPACPVTRAHTFALPCLPPCPCRLPLACLADVPEGHLWMGPALPACPPDSDLPACRLPVTVGVPVPAHLPVTDLTFDSDRPDARTCSDLPPACLPPAHDACRTLPALACPCCASDLPAMPCPLPMACLHLPATTEIDLFSSWDGFGLAGVQTVGGVQTLTLACHPQQDSRQHPHPQICACLTPTHPHRLTNPLPPTWSPLSPLLDWFLPPCCLRPAFPHCHPRPQTTLTLVCRSSSAQTCAPCQFAFSVLPLPLLVFLTQRTFSAKFWC